ncbi:peptidoglycan-binding protein [Streptomyces bobili]|uniref:peptidoglycan-binding domain-containing protein n=1 Tax=Streptomyces TaxID=1883 RepID=UPI00225195D1|nr:MULTISPECIES: peptidoglycan-binding protein [Streptomyces]MCX5526056.1 peptidoglycan-binding protein [Streptomyces bobili]MDX3574342.1 peptidoglycan-binding protein [Streptomyces sp. ID05-47C]
MTLRKTHTRLGAGIVAGLAACALAVSASPASASASSGFINGGATYTDDFGDEGLLSTSSYSNSSATCLWQQILWAEGANESDGTDFDLADADGMFGSNTQHATKRLQVTWGLADSFNDADGKVGTNTFGYADSKLRFASGSTASGEYLRVRYDGAVRDLDFLRTQEGRYILYTSGSQAGGGAVYASYTANYCD